MTTKRGLNLLGYRNIKKYIKIKASSENPQQSTYNISPKNRKSYTFMCILN